MLLLLCLSATHAAPDPISYDDRRQEAMSRFTSELALAFSSDPWEENLTDEEQAFYEDEEETGEEEIEREAMLASETNVALLKAIIAQTEYLNKYDKPVKKDCNQGEGFYKIQSIFHRKRNDRRWSFECRKVVQNNASVTCTKTESHVNGFKKPILFSCGDNEYMAGVESYHKNRKEDRKWKFTCCSASNHITSDCRLTDNVNQLGKTLDFQAGDGEVITGVNSQTYNSRIE